MILEVNIWGKYRGIYKVTEYDLLRRIVPKVQYTGSEGHCSNQQEVWGCCEPPSRWRAERWWE